MPQYLQLSVTTDAGFDQSHSGPWQKPVGVIAGVVLSVALRGTQGLRRRWPGRSRAVARSVNATSIESVLK